jgi:murein hydrolase activator
MFKNSFILFFLLVLIFSELGAQSRDELQKKSQELKREIDELNKELATTKKSTKSALKQFAIIKKKINAREALVNEINREVKQLDETIYLNERDIYRLKKELDTLKTKYSKSIVFAYKNRGSYEYLNFLFSAGDFNDAIKRMAYLKSYRQNRETQAVAIVKSEQLLTEKVQVLSSNKKERLGTLDVQSKQLVVLQEDKKEQDQVVAQLKGKEKELSTQMREKEKQREKVLVAVNAVIRREIEEARKRDEAKKLRAIEDAKKAAIVKAPEPNKGNIPKEKPIKKSTDTEPQTGMSSSPKDRNYSPLESTPEGMEMSLNFENSKGKLPWPVSNGIITVVFGTQSIAGTKLMQKSDGIEIAVPVGSSVRCVADGEVVYAGEVADELIVLVKHGKYFTGYKNLTSLNVNKDQQVKAGTVLGKSGTSIDGEGSILFMIMNDKSIPQNPTPWLKSR